MFFFGGGIILKVCGGWCCSILSLLEIGLDYELVKTLAIHTYHHPITTETSAIGTEHLNRQRINFEDAAYSGSQPFMTHTKQATSYIIHKSCSRSISGIRPSKALPHPERFKQVSLPIMLYSSAHNSETLYLQNPPFFKYQNRTVRIEFWFSKSRRS